MMAAPVDILITASGESPSQAMSKFLTHRNWEIIKVSCLKLLSFGAICYTATDD